MRACSLNAVTTDPGALVADVSSHVSAMTEKALYVRKDFPPEALQLYQADLYRREVTTWGHAGFIGRSQQNLADALSDAGKALRACGAEDYRDLFEKMQTWIALNPEDAADLTGEEEDDEAPGLSRLDRQFQALEAKGRLVSALAEWIATKPWLEAVEDAEFGRAQRCAIADARRKRGSGLAETVAEIDRFLSNPAIVGFGMAAAAPPTPEPVIHIGCVQHLTTGPDKIAPARWMRTVAGERFGVLVEDGFGLFEAVLDQPEPTSGPKLSDLRRLRHDRIDEILFHYPHKLGKRLAVVPKTRAKLAIQVCHHLHAACAIHLLLERLPEPATLTCASIHSIGKAADGGLKAVVMIVADDATRAFSAVIDHTGAALLSEPDHSMLAQIGRREIVAQQKTLRTA